jgi:hypothetical protein
LNIPFICAAEYPAGMAVGDAGNGHFHRLRLEVQAEKQEYG